MGVDPGTAITGYGILDCKKNGNIKVVGFGCIKTSKDLDMSTRLVCLYNDFCKLLKKYKPQNISLERIFFNTNVKTALSVGQARGVVMLGACQNNIPVFEYTALQAKLILTGYGRAKKNEMQLAVPKYLKMEGKIKEDDAADGLALAITHFKKINEQKNPL